ncbi:DDB1- and CUL4-associated factor 11 [Mizuhopecten yessoensis]|uniref:DDB1-and CUL4-associated factor 11 n=1 Tax=Mizuhopecten yessoensis TaxID=6573 RepID=A0A210QXQ9_MIZYE|nr:DDB1- and CUL4-associated factor 11 [Mizuhopecten yessoensis]
MGSSNSSNRQDQSQRMTESAENPAAGAEEEQTDLQAIIAYLIRSGQVRILRHEDDSNVEDEDEDDTEFYGPANPPTADRNPDTGLLEKSDLKQLILGQSGRTQKRPRMSIPTLPHMIQNREIGANRFQQFTGGDRRIIGCQFLPNHQDVVAKYHHKVFCGTFSKEGNIFLTACQDQHIRIYDTTRGNFNLLKTIRAKDVGWSILDTAFSPDGNYIIYSSWSDCIHLCNIHGEYDTHNALHLFPGEHSFCIFSLTFSSDNREILGGANDGCLYVYDRESNQRTLRIDAHEDDVNAVAFADSSSQILFSGGDDGLLKVWDRRTLREENPIPVGVLAGHSDGITYIDSKGDARFLLSNCKDQSMKLWDVRRFSSQEGVQSTKGAVAKQRWDYRWQQFPKRASKKKILSGDSSIMTYRGHSVLNTLIRCHFSPELTTGQRYVYSGCASGTIVVYDLLTGKIVAKLSGHNTCVRDVSWHPYENIIMSTSWDSTVGKWTYKYQDPSDNEETQEMSGDEDENDSDEESFSSIRRHRRSSARLRMLQRRRRKANVCVEKCGLLD